MENDTLKPYLGRVVKVETATTYAGRVTAYDHDFITLNPFMPMREFAGFNEKVERELAKREGGCGITLGRRSIDTIEEIVVRK